MNAQQINYLTAKTALDAANEIANEYMESFDWMLDSDDDEMIELYTDLDCNKRENLNTLELRLAKEQAEKELLSWSRKHVAMIAHMHELGAINVAYEAANKNIKIRHQIIEAAMKLQ